MSGVSWVMFGCRTKSAVDVAEAVWRRGDELAALVDNLPDPPTQDWAPGVPVYGADEIPIELADAPYLVPQPTPGPRFTVVAAARALGIDNFPALIDRTAVVGRTSTIADGALIGSGVLLGGLVQVDEFALVSRGSAVSHHGRVGAFATLAPCCSLAGSVVVGPGAFIGTGAVVAPEVVIGANATVGAGAVVISDVPDGAVVVGNPARVLRSGATGFGGVTVPAAGMVDQL